MTLADLCVRWADWLRSERIDLSKVQDHTLSVRGTRKGNK